VGADDDDADDDGDDADDTWVMVTCLWTVHSQSAINQDTATVIEHTKNRTHTSMNTLR